MRIGYVIWSLGLGGAEQVVLRLASACARRGHAVTVFTLNDIGTFAGELTAQGIPVVSMRKRGPFDLLVVRRLARAFREHRLDVIHTHLWGANLWGRLAARRAGVPLIVATEHNVDTWKRAHHVLIDRFLAPRTDVLIAVSEQVRRFYEARGVGAGRWQVVYNGIGSAPEAPRTRGAAYQALGIGAEEPVVGLVGRLVASKAPNDFLAAVAEASRTVPALKALVIGDGPLRQAAEAQARRLGIGARVVFTGLRKDVPALLAGMDVLAFSSEREGLSIAMLEAMAAGVPVVATAVGGTPELIEDGVSGLLVPPRAPSALAQALARLLADRPAAGRISRAARERVAARFSLERMVAAHDALYHERPSRPSTVAYVIDHLGVGGAQRQLVELAKALRTQQAWRPVVIALSVQKTTLVDELSQAGVTVHLIEQRRTADPACLWRLIRVLRRERPAIVHTWLFTADCYGRIAAWLAGVTRTVCALRNTIDDMPPRQRLVNRWLTYGTSRVTVNADAIREGLIREGGVPARKIVTIHNGLTVRDAPGAAANGRHRAGLQMPPTARVVGMVARLSAQKDHRTFIEAAVTIAAARPDVYFLLIGDGALRQQIERLVDASGIGGRFRLLGERRDVWELWPQIDCCVLSTRYEGCSNVIMEAMAAGRPVVATDVGGNRELIVDGETGRLVPPGNAAALADAVLDILREPHRAATMGASGQARIRAGFTIEAAAAKTQALYRELLTGRRTA